MTSYINSVLASSEPAVSIMDSVDEDVEEKVEKLVNGEGLEVLDFDFMPDHVQAVTLRKNVFYIVSAVIFNTKVMTINIDIFDIQHFMINMYHISMTVCVLVCRRARC